MSGRHRQRRALWFKIRWFLVGYFGGAIVIWLIMLLVSKVC